MLFVSKKAGILLARVSLSPSAFPLEYRESEHPSQKLLERCLLLASPLRGSRTQRIVARRIELTVLSLESLSASQTSELAATWVCSSREMSALVVRNPVSPRNLKIGRRTKKTDRSRTTALRTGCLSSSSHALQFFLINIINLLRMNEKRTPSLIESFLPIIFLVILLSINVSIFGNDALSGSIQIVLILSSSIAAIIAFNLGYKWIEIQKGIQKSINSAIPSILILFLVGSLAGSWLLSGIVPALIYYGIQILNAKIFLFAACIICIIVSMATGSSWTTSATIGIALIGIGKALNISEGIIAGAILSGA